MLKPIFYFKKLKRIDYILIVIYLLLSILSGYLFFTSKENEPKRDILFVYTIGSHFYIYFFIYRALRNLSFYVVWLFFASIHLYFYFQLKNDLTLSFLKANPVFGLRNTIILLILYQLFRVISLNIQKQEFVPPTKGGKDIYDNRKSNILDHLFFILYVVTIITLSL